MIYPQVQHKVIGIFVLAGGLGFLGFLCGAVIFGQQIFQLVEATSTTDVPSNQLIISQIWFNFTFFLVIFGIIYVAGLFIVGMFFSHRLVGPLMRITKSLSGMIESNKFSQLQIRDTDFLSEIVLQLNQTIEKRNKANDDAKAK